MDIMVTNRTNLPVSLLSSAVLQKPIHHSKIKPSHHQQPNPSSPHLGETNLEETKQIHAQLIKGIDPNYPIPFEAFHLYTTTGTKFNSLITSYIKNNRPSEAVNIYAYMRKNEAEVDNFTIPSILKACGQLSCTQQGKEIHGFILKSGLDWDVFIHNALIQMYSECGSMDSASQVFNKMPERDVVSWSTMIGSFSKNKFYREALDLIREMHLLQVKPSEIAMVNMVGLATDLASLEMGKKMHTYVIKHAFELVSTRMTTALIDMYAKCGSISHARRLFDGLSQKSVVSWTAMIAGYIRSGNLEQGMEVFSRMKEEGVLPNEITMLSLVLESGSVGALDLGKQLHAYILRNGFHVSVALATALVDMYGRCGEIRSAKALFDGMGRKDIMAWTAMITAYSQAKCLPQALKLFLEMRKANIEPNEVTFIILISLCADAGALDLGKWIHAYIDKQGIQSDVILTTALVDMYAKCGDIDRARWLFNASSSRDICMWNAMMCGLAMHGCGEEALELFSKLERTEINPNDITFIGVLHACSHAGLVTEGRKLFNRMIPNFRLIPKVEHYGCMVDLLGRAGLLEEALKLINSMPVKPNTIVWGALLAACKLHRNSRLGELAARQLLKMEPDNCGYSVMLSNIYAAANRWNDVALVRRAMKDTGIKKAPGVSSIEVNGTVHEFLMGGWTHPQTKEIHQMLVEMTKKLKQVGYVADTSTVLQNIDEEEKETALSFHSEKLAIAFGLISTTPGTTIRIMKNLRVCEDCHAATKLLSKIYGRVIIVRDRIRFHHFSEGSCSCRDYW